MNVSPLKTMEDRFPSLLPTMNIAIDTSYVEVQKMLTVARRNEPCWNDYIPHNLYSAVQTNVYNEINSLGYPNLKAEYRQNKRHNHKHVEILGPGFLITVHSANGPHKPRNAVYRSEIANASQLNWFQQLREENLEQIPVYFTVTYQICRDEMESFDNRIILMTPTVWSEEINESIKDRVLPAVTIEKGEGAVAKEERIQEPAMPALKAKV